jgi:hypothetical protein
VAALLGGTRATVLSVIGEQSECSANELAALADVAPAGDGEHATVLRTPG